MQKKLLLSRLLVSYCPESDRHIRNEVKVLLDLSNVKVLLDLSNMLSRKN